jgi:hypothetical protein
MALVQCKYEDDFMTVLADFGSTSAREFRLRNPATTPPRRLGSHVCGINNKLAM